MATNKTINKQKIEEKKSEFLRFFEIFRPFLKKISFFYGLFAFLDFLDFLYFFGVFFGFFLDFLGFFKIFGFFEFFGYLDFFLDFFLLFLVSFKVTKVTTKCYHSYYWTPEIAKNGAKQHKKPFFCPKGKKSPGQRPKPSTGARSRPA